MAAGASPQQQNESMEEILHSIRDIIADDDKKAPSKDAAADDEDVLELTDIVEKEPEAPKAEPVSETPPPIAEEKKEEPKAAENDILSDIDAALDVKPQQAAEITEPAEEEKISQANPVEAPIMAEEPKNEQAPETKKKTLLSEEKAKASSAAIKNLVDNIPKPKIDSKSFRGGHTVEDLVVEAITPMLSKWLDSNLPKIVEDMVQKEIKKLIPRD